MYVRPIVEYCSSVWCPVYKCDVDLIEKVQRRFTKRLAGLKYMSYGQRLHYLKAETLEVRRLKADLIMMFKMLNNGVDTEFCEFFRLNTNRITRGHCFKLAKPRSSVNARDFSFACRRIDCWNLLPETVVKANTVNVFKKRLLAVDFNRFVFYKVA